MKYRKITVGVLEGGCDHTQLLKDLFIKKISPVIDIVKCNELLKLNEMLKMDLLDILLVDPYFFHKNDLNFEIKKLSKILPILMLSSGDDHETILETIRNGAEDYIVPDDITAERFLLALTTSIERRSITAEIEKTIVDYHHNEARMFNLIRSNADGMLILGTDLIIRFANPAAAQLLGKSISELEGTLFEYSFKKHKRIEIQINENGYYAVLEVISVNTEWDKDMAHLISMRDISSHKKTEEGLKSALANLEYALASEKVLLEELNKRNRDLVELSIKDGLTGLYNHRFIQEKINYEFKRSKRYGTDLSCMLIDIDHFKKINDQYGHQFGDLVLRELSSLLKMNTREIDICGRYGGEEFMIVSPQNSSQTLLHADKISKAIENHKFENEENSIHVTVSIGVSEYSKDVETKHELIERADIALYQAKDEGRNLIRVWKKEQESENNKIDKEGIANLKGKIENLTTKARSAYIESTSALLKAIDAKDHYTLTHSRNVAKYSIEIAKGMNMTDDQIDVIGNAALLHDIGKIGIDKSILTKSTAITDVEFELLKKHSIIGAEILKDVSFLEREIPIIQHHHEWYNGHGYPDGLKGKEIPFGALIVSVADSFDAMTTSRIFQEKMSFSEAIQEIIDGIDTHYSPEVVDIFLKIANSQGEKMITEVK